MYTFLVVFFFFEGRSQTRDQPVNPCQGLRVSWGCEMLTPTRTPTYPYPQPMRV